jgi:hypothetical protein
MRVHKATSRAMSGGAASAMTPPMGGQARMIGASSAISYVRQMRPASPTPMPPMRWVGWSAALMPLGWRSRPQRGRLPPC